MKARLAALAALISLASPAFAHPDGALPGSLGLSDEQKDDIFRIRYSDMPKLHEQQMIFRKARRTLHELAISGKFDSAEARASARQEADALYEMAMLRAAEESRIHAILTPEQREKAEKLRQSLPQFAAMR